jgi:hypothetical protein
MKRIIPLLFISSAAFADSTLQWDASAGATKYYFYEIKGSTPVKLAETTGLDNQIIPVLVGSHVYAVSAVSSKGEGPLSNMVNVTVTAVPGASPVPLAPANLKLK